MEIEPEHSKTIEDIFDNNPPKKIKRGMTYHPRRKAKTLNELRNKKRQIRMTAAMIVNTPKPIREAAADPDFMDQTLYFRGIGVQNQTVMNNRYTRKKQLKTNVGKPLLRGMKQKRIANNVSYDYKKMKPPSTIEAPASYHVRKSNAPKKRKETEVGTDYSQTHSSQISQSKRRRLARKRQ